MKYQNRTTASSSDELATVKLRYKWQREDTSRLLSKVVGADSKSLDECSEDFRFSSSVAAWGMILRDSEFKGAATLSDIHEIAEDALGQDRGGLRSGFLELVEKSETLEELESDDSD